MDAARREVSLCADNFGDYLLWDYPLSLVRGLEIGEDGIDAEGAIVATFREWIARESRMSERNEYVCNKTNAAEILTEAAK